MKHGYTKIDTDNKYITVKEKNQIYRDVLLSCLTGKALYVCLGAGVMHKRLSTKKKKKILKSGSLLTVPNSIRI